MTAQTSDLPWAESIAPDGATRVSAAVFAQNVAAVAEYRGSAAQVDAAYDPDALVETAEVVAGIMWAGLSAEFPAYDEQLIALLERDGETVSVAAALRSTGYVVETTAGRLGITIGGGQTVESTGDALSIVVGPSAERYVRAWRIPSVSYAWAGDAA